QASSVPPIAQVEVPHHVLQGVVNQVPGPNLVLSLADRLLRLLHCGRRQALRYVGVSHQVSFLLARGGTVRAVPARFSLCTPLASGLSSPKRERSSCSEGSCTRR